MVRQFGRGAVVLALAGVATPSVAPSSDPAQNLARVRLVVTTTAATADITVGGATIASYLSSVLDGLPSVYASQTGHTLRLSRNVPGESAEGRFDIILAGVVSGGALVWNLTTDSTAETQIEVYSLNDLNHAVLVDRFVANGTAAQFTTASALVDSRDRVRVAPFVPHLVLAHFYPWYTFETWKDSRLADRPLRPYSTDDQTDVNDEARQARSAGIDVFVVSWQGKEAGNGFNDRRMRVVLEAGRVAGLRVAAYTETLVANPANSYAAPTDPETMFAWLADLVDMYGSHPAYLRVEGRPVILIYSAWQLGQSDWAELMARLRGTGLNPLLIGDFYHSTLLEPLDGEYQYSNVGLSGDALLDVDRTESLRLRTYNLLRPNDRRRIWIASVTPGADDTRLTERQTHQVIDRSNGRVYDDQWAAAIDTAADWVIVTSWNEWWENTEIEPSERYGSDYLERTRAWASLFKGSQGGPVKEKR